MGFKKSREVAGFNAEYWNIGSFSWSKDGGVNVSIPNYKDKPTRDESISNRIGEAAIVCITPDEAELSAFIAHLYEKAKETNTSIDNETEIVDEIEVKIPFFRDALDE